MESARSDTAPTEAEFATERTLGVDRSNKENHPSHCRTSSLQMSFFRDQTKEEEAEEGNLAQFLEEIRHNQQDSRQLQVVYELAGQMLRFKRTQLKNALK